MSTGIGPETAEAILHVHPTPRSLYEAFLAATRGAAAVGGDARQAPGRVLEGIEVRKQIKHAQDCCALGTLERHPSIQNQ